MSEKTPRSTKTYQAAIFSPLLSEPVTQQPQQPIVIPELITLAQLFQEEEGLAALIADDEGSGHKYVDQDIIDRAVEVARKIAAAGYPLQMVDLDEMLDTICLYYLDEPNIQPHTVADWASRSLSHLQKAGNNSAWTARVAATLAYFSVLPAKK